MYEYLLLQRTVVSFLLGSTSNPNVRQLYIEDKCHKGQKKKLGERGSRKWSLLGLIRLIIVGLSM